MRTTVDLPPAVHARARRLAEERGTSLSSVLADLTARGLASMQEPPRLTRNPATGILQVDPGRVITAEEVAELLGDE